MINRRLVLTLLVGSLFVGASAARMVGGVEISAQQRQTDASRGQQPPAMQDMMKMHEQMMADMKAANAKLDQLAQKMDTATGQAKVDATAAVVKELVAQHRAMCDRMGQVHQQMMGMPSMMKK